MNRIINICLLATLFNVIPSTSYSQESSCFMQSSSGANIDLSSLCGGSNQKNSLSSQAKVFSATIKRREGGIPVIDVKFNDKLTFEMLVDTGASSTILTENMAKNLDVKAEGEFIAETPSHSQVTFAQGTVKSIAIGGAVVKDLAVAISPSLSIGLLGQNFFGRYDVTIKEKVIEFRVRS
jgi:aspartyl protease family protein